MPGNAYDTLATIETDYLNGSIAFDDAIGQVIGLASGRSLDLQVHAGIVLATVVGAAPYPAVPDPWSAVGAAIDAAVAAGTLTDAADVALSAGMVASPDGYTASVADIRLVGLIGSGAATGAGVVQTLVVAFGAASPDSEARAVAEIRSIASTFGVSDVALSSTIDGLVASNGVSGSDATHLRAQLAEAAALSGFSGQSMAASGPIAQLLAIAAAGDVSTEIHAGMALAQLVSRTVGGGEGSEGGGGSGPDATASAARTAIHTAVTNGTLTKPQAFAILAGMAATSVQRATSAAQSEISTLVVNAADAPAAIDALAEAFPIAGSGERYSLASNISARASSAGITLPALVAQLHGLVAPDTLTAIDEITILTEVAVIRGVTVAANVSPVASEISALIADGAVDRGAALDAMITGARSAGTFTSGSAFAALKMVLGLASVDAMLAGPAAVKLAPLIDVTSPSYAVLTTTAQQVVDAVISARSVGQISAATAVGMLAVLGSAPGAPIEQARDPLHLAGDAIRDYVAGGTISGAAAAAAIVAAASSAGLSADKAVMLLVGIGSNGTYQYVGPGYGYVANEALAAAFGDALAAFVAAHPALTPAGIAADLARAFAFEDDVLIERLVARAGMSTEADATTRAKIGSALASAVATGTLNATAATGTLLDRIHQLAIDSAPDHRGAQAIDVLIGFAHGSTSADDEVLVGRQIAAALVYDAAVAPTDAAAAVSAALTGGQLSATQAVQVLAGLATDPSGSGRAAAWSSLAAIVSADPTRVAALDAAIGGSGAPIAVDDGLKLLANVAALASAAAGTAIAADIVALVHRSPVVTSADHAVAVLLGALGQAGEDLLGPDLLAAQAKVAAAVGQEIVALVNDTAVSASGAVAAVGSAVAAATDPLDPHRAVAALANLQAAGLDAAAVRTGLTDLIEAGVLTVRQVVGDLIALRVPSGSAALTTVLTDEIEAILYDPAHFAETAGLGTTAEVQHVADLTAALFGSNAAAAQAVLDAFATRIATGIDVTGTQVAAFLVDLYGEGGTAATAALAGIQALTGSSLTIDNVTGPIGDAIGTGHLTSAAAFALLEALRPGFAGQVRSEVATLILDQHATVAQLDAEVRAGRFPAADAILALGEVVQRGSGGIRTVALTEISLLTGQDPGLASAALGTYLALASSLDASDRATGYAGIDVLTGLPGLGAQALTGLIPLVADSNLGVHADALTGLAAILADGHIAAGQVTSALTNELSLFNPTLNPDQVLELLVELAGVPSAQADLYSFIYSIAGQNYARAQAHNPPYGFSPDAAIEAIGNTVQGDLAHSGPAAVELRILISLSSSTSTEILDKVALASRLTLSEQTALAAEIVSLNGAPGATFAYGQVIAQRGLPLSQLAEVVADDGSHLSRQKAVEILLGVYQGHATTTALTAFSNLVSAGALTPDAAAYFIRTAIESHGVTARLGIEVLAALSAGGSAAMQASVAATISDAITGGLNASTGTIAAGDLMTALTDAVADHAVTSLQAFVLTEDVLLYRLGQGEGTNLLSGPAFVAATDALKSAVTTELAYLASHGVGIDVAITTLAKADAGATAAQRVGLGQQIAELASTLSVADTAVVADILAARSGTGALTDAQAADILVATGGAGGRGLQIEAGRAIAGLHLVSGGAYQAVYGPLTLHSLTAEADLGLAIGLIAGGASADAGQILDGLQSYYIPLADIAIGLAASVTAGMITGSQAVAAGAAMTASFGRPAEAIAILNAVVGSAHIGPTDAVAALGGTIGSGFFGPTLAMQVVTTFAAGLSAADERAAGRGLGELLAGGSLTSAQVWTGLSVAVDGTAIPPVSPVLTYDQASALLLGVASDGSPAALAANVAGTAGSLIAGLVAGDAGRLSALIASVDAALDGHDLAVPTGISLLTGIAGGSDATGQTAVAAHVIPRLDAAIRTDTLTPAAGLGLLLDLAGVSGQPIQASVGQEIGALLAAGTIDRFVATGSVLSAVSNHRVSGAVGVFVVAEAVVDASSLGQGAQTIGQMLTSGLVSAADTRAQILAAHAASPTTVTTAETVDLLVQLGLRAQLLGVNTPAEFAMLAEAGIGLGSLLTAGELSVTDLIAAPRNVTVPVLFAIAAEPHPASADAALYDAMLSRIGSGLEPISSVMDATVRLVTSGALPVASSLSALLRFAERSQDAGVRGEVGKEIGSLLGSHAITSAQLGTAISDGVQPAGQVSATAAILVLAGGVDPFGAGAPQSLLDQIRYVGSLGITGPDILTAIRPMIAAIDDAVRHTGALSHETGLTVPQAIAALSALATYGSDPARQAISAEILGLARDAAAPALIIQSLVAVVPDASSASQAQKGALLADVASALGYSLEALIQQVVAQGPGSVDTLVRLATLDPGRPFDPATSDPFSHVGLKVGAAIDTLLGGGLTADQTAAAIGATTGVSAEQKLLVLLGFGSGGPAAAKLAAGHEIAVLELTSNLATAVITHVVPVPNADLVLIMAGIMTGTDQSERSLGSSLLSSFVTSGQFAPADIIAQIDGAITSGALSATAAVDVLAQAAGHANQLPAYTLALGEELASFVSSGRITAPAAIAELTRVTGFASQATSSAILAAEVGGLVAALVRHGQVSASAALAAVDSAVAAGRLSEAQAVGLVAGAGIYSDDSVERAATFGDWVGQAVEAGRIGTQAALDQVVAAAQALYGLDQGTSQVTVIAAIAGHGAPGLQNAAGQAIATLYGTTAQTSTVIPALDARIDMPLGLSARQAEALLLGTAEAFSTGAAGLAGVRVVARELDALIGRAKLTAADVLATTEAEIAGGRLSSAVGVALLTYMAADSSTLLAPVAEEIAHLVSGGQATAAAAIDAIAAATEAFAWNGAPDMALASSAAHLVEAVIDRGVTSLSDVVAALEGARGDGRVGSASEAAILVALSHGSGDADLASVGRALGGAFGSLAEGTAERVVSDALASGAADHGLTLSRLAYAIGAMAPGSARQAFEDGFGRLLGQSYTATEVAVAIDHVHAGGGLDGSAAAGLLVAANNGSADIGPIVSELRDLVQGGEATLAGIAARAAADFGSLNSGSNAARLVATIGAGTTPEFQIAVGRALAGHSLNPYGVVGGISDAGLGPSSALLATLAFGSAEGTAALGVSGFLIGGTLASVTVGRGDVDSTLIGRLDGALTAGALTAADLVVFVAGMASADFPSPYAISTASAELAALVSSGRISAAAAMAAIDGAAVLDLRKTVHWLAAASATPALRDAIATELAYLATAGTLTPAQVLTYIREMTGRTPSDVASLAQIANDTAAKLLIGIAAHGNVALQDGVGTDLAPLVRGGASLSDLDAAITSGQLSGTGAAHVVANLLAALPSDPGGAVEAWATTKLPSYVATGRIGAAGAASVLVAAAPHATATGIDEIGTALASLTTGTGAIHDAIQSGALAIGRAVDLLLRFDNDQYPAARTEILSLVSSGAVSGSSVLAAAQAAGSLSDGRFNDLIFRLADSGDAGTVDTVASYLAAREARFGPASDPFFSGALKEAAIDFVKVTLGHMTLDEARADILSYADAHDVSAYAGLIGLQSLFQGYNQPGNAGRMNVILSNEIVLGNLGRELAHRVVEGELPRKVLTGGYWVDVQPDPSAITNAAALSLLTYESGRAYLPGGPNPALNLYNTDHYVYMRLAQSDYDFRIQASQFQYESQFYNRDEFYLVLSLEAGKRHYNDFSLDLGTIQAPIQFNFLAGGPERGYADGYATGLYTYDQAIGLVERQAAISAGAASGSDYQHYRDMGLAWLDLRAREIARDEGRTDKGLIAQDLSNALHQGLEDDLLTGYGAILSLSSNAGGVLSQVLKADAYDAAFGLARQHAGHSGLADDDQKALDIAYKIGDGASWLLSKDSRGRALLTVLDDPTDAANYVRLGNQIGAKYAGSVVLTVAFGSTPIGAAITAAQFGSQIMLAILSIGAVQSALGPTATGTLKGYYTIGAATAALFGNVLADIGDTESQRVLNVYVPHYIELQDAYKGGDASAIASASGEVALDYFSFVAGVDLRQLGTAGERFGILMFHLFSGDTGALNDDIHALGGAFLDILQANPLVGALGTELVKYGNTVNQALHDIGEAWSFLGTDVTTGAVKLGTRLDDAGHVIRDVARKIGGVLGDAVHTVLHGIGLDGYVAGATVFGDANFNGVLDPGEVSAITDATGHYTLIDAKGPIVLTGGVDIATKLAFTGTLTSPAGSGIVSPLTTLVQKVAAAGSGDPDAAEAAVVAALGLPSGTDITGFDPIAAVVAGDATGRSVLAAAVAIINTATLITSTGATGDVYGVLAHKIGELAGASLHLTDSATVAAIATEAGLSGAALTAAVQLATASNALAVEAIGTGASGVDFLKSLFAVAVDAQGATAAGLKAAAGDEAALHDVVAGHTGSALDAMVADARAAIGDLGGIDNPPSLTADALSISVHTITSGNVLTNDQDANPGDTISVTEIGLQGCVATAVSCGNVTIAGQHGLLTIGPDGSYSYLAISAGQDVFAYRATDGHGASATSTLTTNAAAHAPDHDATFAFAFTQASVAYIGTEALLTGPDGTTRDVTGIGHLHFTDGAIDEQDGSPLVDDLFYYARNLDVWQAHIDARQYDADQHFAQFGWHEGRDPNPLFSTSGYLAQNPDVAAAGIDPLAHYDLYGWQEGRNPGSAFSTSAYLALNQDVATQVVDPLAHALADLQGVTVPNPPSVSPHVITGDFDATFYLARNADVAAAGLNPLQHYNAYGWHEGRDPDAFFSTREYLAANPDVAAAGIDPLLHYEAFGWHEGRNPSSHFSTQGYLAANPDVAAAGIDPLQHYLQYGQAEGRHGWEI